MNNLTKTLIVIIALFFIQSCKKDKPLSPVVTTTAISAISYTTATSGGEVTSDGGSALTARGICWTTSAEPTLSNNKTNEGVGLGTFISNLTQLTPNTLYYVRSYATNSAGTSYGNQVSFTTSAVAVPVLTTTNITSVTSKTAVSGGNITSENGGSVTSRGVCWGIASNPTTGNDITVDGSGIGSFVSNISGLQPVTKYYLRSYAINSAGTAYGNELSFTTVADLATLTTTAISNITRVSATSGGNITDDGGGTISARGVCWNTSQNPTVDNSLTSDGSGSGIFVSDLTDLVAGTTYYVRAYATNSAGTNYGNEISFTTVSIEVPTLTTAAVSLITMNMATSGGNVTSDGGAIVTARGVCWNTSQNPTVDNSFTSNGSGSGIFVSDLTELVPATTYYVRAYATNEAGTAYGNQETFSTDPYPSIRLKTGTGLSYGAHIYFLALSKNVNYFNLSADELFAYTKTEADWYIDGDVIPFTTEYKEFKLPIGVYYLLMSASGTVVVTTMTVVDGQQTVLVSASQYTGISIHCDHPKKSGQSEQILPKLIEYKMPGQAEYLIK